eukprot:tig00020556_g11026.t1
MGFLCGVLTLVRQLLTVVIVGVMSAQEVASKSTDDPSDSNAVGDALASLGESFAPMLQVTLLLGINIFTLVLHIVSRPFICRWTPAALAVNGTTALRISLPDAREGALDIRRDLDKALEALKVLRKQKQLQHEDVNRKPSIAEKLRARQLKIDDDTNRMIKDSQARQPAPEADVPRASKRLNDDTALDGLLGERGLFSEEAHATELERRKRLLQRREERGQLKGDRRRTRRLKAEWEAADRARLRRLRYWRSVVRELWRFGHVEILSTSAGEAESRSTAPRSPVEIHRAASTRARRRSLSSPALLRISSEPTEVGVDEPNSNVSSDIPTALGSRLDLDLSSVDVGLMIKLQDAPAIDHTAPASAARAPRPAATQI